MKKRYQQAVKHKVQNKNHSQHSVFIDFISLLAKFLFYLPDLTIFLW